MKVLWSIPLFFLATALGGCSREWPDDYADEVRALLSRGPKGLQCWDSAWMKRNKQRNFPYFSDDNRCKSSLKILDIYADDERVTGVARCRIGQIQAEYKLSVFRSEARNDLYGGYFCTKAQGVDIFRFPVGSLTDAEGAR